MTASCCFCWDGFEQVSGVCQLNALMTVSCEHELTLNSHELTLNSHSTCRLAVEWFQESVSNLRSKCAETSASISIGHIDAGNTRRFPTPKKKMQESCACTRSRRFGGVVSGGPI